MDLNGLNDPQRAAVLHEGSPLVVFAGAGSGKTRVITHRVAHIIAQGEILPWQMMAVTFTNKAAAEMRERLTHLVPGQTRGLRVGTFHATCARFLRNYADGIGLRRDFTIYDDADQRAAIKRIVKDLKLDEKRFPVRGIASTINRAKQEVLGPEDLDIDNPFIEIHQRVYREYEKRLEQSGALDFGDLISRLVMGLERNETLRLELAGRFVHLLVDEFQDTNHAQFRLVKSLASIHRNLVVVGDDDQSIYRWRGADRRNILDFHRTFPDARVIKLEQNYRSTQRILRVAHSVIARNIEREPKEMWTENAEGEVVLVLRASDERAEANEVVNGVQELQHKGELLSSIAVFYRVHAQARVLEEALRHANLPYRIVGGLRFYDRAEVKDLLAYLRILVNPDDDVGLLRIINTPARGIGKTTITRLLDLAAENGLGVWKALDIVGSDDRFGRAAIKKLAAFRDLIIRLQDGVEAGTYDLSDIGGVVLHETGYVDLLKQENTPEADARIQNLEELVGSMQQYKAEQPEARLVDWLNDVTLQTDEQSDETEDRLTLMTVHAAKGLEFDTVIVAGMEEGMFPFKGTEPGEDPEELEEERRLAYVAFTRARRRLVLTWAGVRTIFGQMRSGDTSRFVHEMPAEDIREIGAAMRSSVRPRAKPTPDPWDHDARRGGRREDLTAPRDSGESYIDYSEGSDLRLTQGMRVRHAKFGIGEVREVSRGAPPRVTVLFPQWGRKTIIARFLEPA